MAKLIVTGVAKLKEREEGPILVAGSCTLVHTLIENDLVDELKLMVFPTIVGGGKRVFPESGERRSFKLVDSQTFSTGVQANSYVRA